MSADATKSGGSKAFLELKLLDVLKQSNFDSLQKFIADDLKKSNDIHAKELEKYLLNYAVQVGSLGLIKDIVESFGYSNNESRQNQLLSLDLNAKDEEGNTPLHLAASQGRSDVIEYLMDNPAINDCVVNNKGLQPVEVCKDVNIAQSMQLKRSKYVQDVIQILRKASHQKNFRKMDAIISIPRNKELLDINTIDLDTGKNVLHEAVERGDVEVCKWLLQNGANPTIKNDKGQTAKDMLNQMRPTEKLKYEKIQSLKKLFEQKEKEQDVFDMTEQLQKAPTHKGYLKKFTNFAQGYKVRWFVLSADGKLSYYKDQADSNNSPRGSISLASCYIHVNSSEKLKFDIVGGSSGSSKWTLKGTHPVETNKWIWAIQGAIRYAKDKKSGVVAHPLSVHRAATSATAVKPKEVTEAKHEGRKLGSPQSFSSSSIKLNNNLTASGKSYINKVIETRLDTDVKSPSLKDSPLEQPFSPSTSSLKLPVNSSTSLSSQQTNNVIIKDKMSDHIVDADENSEDGEAEGYLKESEDEEEMSVQNGPFAQEILMLQKSVHLELRSVKKLLEEQDANSDAWKIIHKSMVYCSESFEKLNHLGYQREKKLISLIDNQRDVNKIWIQSVKELEGELGQKDRRLESINRERKTLKRMMKEQLTVVPDTTNNDVASGNLVVEGPVTTLEHVANFINATKDENEDSDVDEFFDAEESQDEEDTNDPYQTVIDELSVNNSETMTPATQPTSLTQQSQLGQTSNVAKNTETAPSLTQNHPNSFASQVPPRNMEKRVPQGIQAGQNQHFTTQHEDARKQRATARVPSDTKAQPVAAATAAVANGHPAQVANTNPFIQTEIKNTSQSTAKPETQTTGKPAANAEIKPAAEPKPAAKAAPASAPTAKSAKKSSVVAVKVDSVAVNSAQEKKEEILTNEGSYLGYEDGIRKRLKLDEDDRPKISLWGVLKSMVGKDMTKMTLPVSFNEPTSLLQRVAEDLEYSELADYAASFEDSTLRMLYVAAFASSSYASTTGRVAKPFNPLLGETFEYCRPDKHYRFMTEQVSHHPPISATWTETPKWDFYGESVVETKFTGRQFNVKHLGLWHMSLRPDKTGKSELYTWKKPDNVVIGILVGNPQVDNTGDVEIKNHDTGDRCVLHFKARGWRASSAYEVRGEVFDKKGKKAWVLGGHWNDSIQAKKVINNKSSDISLERTTTTTSLSFAEPKTDGSTFSLWKANKRSPAPFNLTPFAITLNAPQPNLVKWIAPTDTRLRPDQRAMEDGEYDLAAEEKNRVEVKQRASRKEREDNNVEYKPLWFVQTKHPVTKKLYWQSTGKYWESRKNHSFKNVPDIF